MKTKSIQKHNHLIRTFPLLTGFALCMVLQAASAGAATLWDQTDNPAVSGVPDQTYDASVDFLSSEAADDFDVDAANGWRVDSVNTIGTSGVPGHATVDITFYSDNGGTPLGGNAVCSHTGIVPVDNQGSLTITLPAPCNLPMGIHWVAIKVNQSFFNHGQHFWSVRRTQNLSTAVWRNPGQGFSPICTDWTDIVTCQIAGNPGPPESPDLLFQIVGEVQP